MYFKFISIFLIQNYFYIKKLYNKKYMKTKIKLNQIKIYKNIKSIKIIDFNFVTKKYQYKN